MKPIIGHLLRIDPRSLGLFRFLFGIALIGDLLYRWANLDAFYTNEGVLPNHVHISTLKQQGKFLWSALHAFSSDGEVAFGFALILFFYTCFTIGWKTRAFHVLAVVSLVSLSARNTLAAGPGDYLGIAMLIMTCFLPLGTAYSVDAFLLHLRSARETPHEDLNDRATVVRDPNVVDALRLPGWSPRSLAAFGVLLQIALVMVVLAANQTGAWKDGSGLGKALQVATFASPLGFGLRDSGSLAPLTHILYWSQWAVPILLVVPVLRGIARSAAAVLLAVYGLSYALLTNLGLFGWTLAASAALVVSSETWEAWATRHHPKRVRTVIYDTDCGVCFLLCQLLKRFDHRGELVFQGNDSVAVEDPKLLRWSQKHQRVTRTDLPKEITPELVDKTVLAVGPDGAIAARSAAVSDVLITIPGLGPLGRLIALPGVSSIANALYDFVAARRTAISVELGLAACAVPQSPEEPHPAAHYRDDAQAAKASKARGVEALAPARRARFRTTAGVRELLAAAFVASVVSQTLHQNGLSQGEPAKPLAEIVWWTRTLADFRIMTPEPPTEIGRIVVDAYTRGEVSVDVLTGEAPDASLRRPFPLGPMWAAYLENLHATTNEIYRTQFRAYVGKRGPRWPAEAQDQKIVGADVYWVSGSTTSDETKPERLFRHGRGGKTFGELGTAAPAPNPNRKLLNPPGRRPGAEPELEPKPGDTRAAEETPPLRQPE